MDQPSTKDLLKAPVGAIDTDGLTFSGPRGDRGRHLSRAVLVAALAEMPPPPTDAGTVDLLVARGASGSRATPERALLSAEAGLAGDRWRVTKHGTRDQLATIMTGVAQVVANGQPLALHGDNLFLDLDLSAKNLPAGSRLRVGEALLEVTEKAHNGCKKWVQRFGLPAMQLNMSPDFRDLNLRGIYLRVIEDGVVGVGDPVTVVSRPAAG